MWKQIIANLNKNGTAVFRPRGDSMVPIINSGDRVTLRLLAPDDVIKKNDVVLAKVKGQFYLHKVAAIRADGRVLIANNRGRNNGWTPRDHVFGLVIDVERVYH